MAARRHPDPDLIALGFRQPWAELILRGVKTIEVRSRNTRVRGPIYVYASQKFATGPAVEAAVRTHALDLEALPTGRLVGTVEILATAPTTRRDASASCVPARMLVDRVGWHLRSPRRLPEPLPVKFLPYGVWFYPFRRRNGSGDR